MDDREQQRKVILSLHLQTLGPCSIDLSTGVASPNASAAAVGFCRGGDSRRFSPLRIHHTPFPTMPGAGYPSALFGS